VGDEMNVIAVLNLIQYRNDVYCVTSTIC